MDPTQLASLRAIWAAARDYKEASVNALGVGTDIPRALVLTTGRQMIGSFPVPDDPTEAFATVLVNVALSDCDLVSLVSEIWTASDHSDTELAARFAKGDPDVEEAVMCVGVTPDGEWRRKISCYQYHGRTIEWHKPQSSTMGPPAFLLNAAAQGFAERQIRTGPALVKPGASLTKIGSQEVGENVMVSFAYHAACPCGSGLAIGNCCAVRN